ncbi:hypothetical protein [Caballeronia sp. LZ035]|uniref:hypothetical protein n=1 Tax=Caballeronia sp. LZ035 TaxID=3038568 RepID=UPI0028675EFD|nr:hypothetical protein [Caballeronia sp. LZ035]MDR5756991.1 hypothetical protein [Caballeronia sp. LZ035]
MSKNKLTVPERVSLVLGVPEHEKNLRELVKQSVSIVEIKNADGRSQCHSAYMVLKNARVGIEKAGKDARDDATKFSKAVIAEVDRLTSITSSEEARLQGIRDVWDEAREAEKRAVREAEEQRLTAIQRAINDIRTTPVDYAGRSSVEIADAHSLLTCVEITPEVFGDQCGHAEIAKTDALKKLTQMLADAQAHEAEVKRLAAERAELARLRAEQKQRERQEKEAQRAREVTERAARIAEEGRIREERLAAEAKLRAEREAHEAEMQAQRDEIARQQAEIAAERRRQEEAAEAKRRAEEEAAAAKRRAEEQAAHAEAESARAEQEVKIAEQKRREHEQFTANGPGDVEIVRTLASHYSVTVGDALEWLKRFDAETADEQFAADRDLQTV